MERRVRIIVPTTVPGYTEDETLIKFNKLKAQYDNNIVVNNIQYDEEYMKELDLKGTMENFNFIITKRLGEIREVNQRLFKLINYKKDLGEILISMRKMEKDYIELNQTHILCGGDLRLEPPKNNFQELLSGDLRGKPDDKDMIVDPLKLRGQLFSIKSEYMNSLCDIYEKVDAKIDEETFKMKKITDFIDIYKKTIDSCDTNKKVLSKYNCTICYENEVAMFIQPCGHTFCNSCTTKISTRCFVCNGPVTAKFKMYVLGKDDDEAIQPCGTRGNGEFVPANDRTYPIRNNNAVGLVGQLAGSGQRI
jgi:hypothetical protein